MRLREIKGCVDGADRLSLLTMTLSDPVRQEKLTLPPIGDLAKLNDFNCKTLTLTEDGS